MRRLHLILCLLLLLVLRRTSKYFCYRLELSVALTKEEGDRMVHELARLTDRAETPAGYDHLYNDWDGGAELGPEYDDNEDW